VEGVEAIAAVVTGVLGTGGAGAAFAKWFLGHVSRMDTDRSKLIERALDDATKGRAEFREALAQQRDLDRTERTQERADFGKILGEHREALARQELECSKQREADRKLMAQLLGSKRRESEE
jgi:F0F1-type ATP synthase membrane subunit b/b'